MRWVLCSTGQRDTSSPQQGWSRRQPRSALLTSVLACEAVERVLHEDDIVRLEHGLRGGVEVAVEPHVGVGAAVVADLDDTREVTHALQSLGTAAPLLPCTEREQRQGRAPAPWQQRRKRRRNEAELAPKERLSLDRASWVDGGS